jgi:uncharacterized membrane protein
MKAPANQHPKAGVFDASTRRKPMMAHPRSLAMADSTEPTSSAASTPEPAAAPPPPPSGQPGPQMSAGEVADGKMFAILCYALNFVGFPFWIIPLITRDNAYSLYHAKQCLIMWIALAVGSLVGGPTIFICVGAVILAAVWITNIIFNVIGVLNANNGMCKPLPVIGKWGEDWFKGIQKKTT